MNFTVRMFKHFFFVPRINQIRRFHRNHTPGLFLGVNVFNNRFTNTTIGNQIIPTDFSRFNIIYNAFLDQNIIIPHSQQWSRQSARIITHTDFVEFIIKHDRCIHIDNTHVFFLLQHLIKLYGVFTNAYPSTVNKHLCFFIHLTSSQILYRNNTW